jgi:methylmalonyl-CoA/ethylmalonyl-CoA epimerase
MKSPGSARKDASNKPGKLSYKNGGSMIIRMSHFGVVVNNMEESTRLWTDTYGLKVIKSGRVGPEAIRNRFLSLGNSYIELLEPDNKRDMNNAVARRLANHGEGIYHVALVVDNLDQTYSDLQKRGVVLTRRDPIEEEPEGRLVVHPKNASGVLLELVTRGEQLPGIT